MFRCTNKKCNAKVIITQNSLEVIYFNNHEAKSRINKILLKIKKIKNVYEVKTNNILAEVISELDD